MEPFPGKRSVVQVCGMERTGRVGGSVNSAGLNLWEGPAGRASLGSSTQGPDACHRQLLLAQTAQGHCGSSHLNLERKTPVLGLV